MIKKYLFATLNICVLLLIMVQMHVYADADIKIGDYMQMGIYYDVPILWRCIDVDKNGPLILSDKVICMKAFDAMGTGNSSSGSHLRIQNRRGCGSNFWADSNIRSWLNSSEPTGKVIWLCGGPPVKERMWGNVNEYDQEAGFLTNFSPAELNSIKTVVQKTNLADADKESDDTGASEYYAYNIKKHKLLPECILNYDNSYAQNIEDKIFLLDIKQANRLYDNYEILGEDYYVAYVTDEAVDHFKNSSDWDKLHYGDRVHVWLRTVEGASYTNVLYIHKYGYIACFNAHGTYGIRPAFYLNTDTAQFQSGSGTDSDPYIIVGANTLKQETDDFRMNSEDNNVNQIEINSINYDGHTYRVFDEGMTWKEANAYCESIGGHLVTITSDDEQKYIENLLSDHTKNCYWLGGYNNDKSNKRNWNWVTEESFEYTNWAVAQPDSHEKADEFYLQIINVTKSAAVAGDRFQWHDICNDTNNLSEYFKLTNLGFVCEWDYIATSYNSEVSQWSSPEMEEAYTLGLIPENLVGENLTKPVSRAEFAAIAVKLYEQLSGQSAQTVVTQFKDIASNVNKSDIEKAYNLNIAVGVTDNEFMPDAGITREQLATMLCRTIKKYKFAEWTYDTDSEYYLDSEGVKKFEDDSLISDYAKPSVYYMVKMGIINGVDNNKFAPRNITAEEEASSYASATREQAIALALRTYKLSDLWK